MLESLKKKHPGKVQVYPFSKGDFPNRGRNQAMPFPWSEKDFRQRVGSGKLEIHFNLFLLVELAITDFLNKRKQTSLVLIMQSTWVQ